MIDEYPKINTLWKRDERGRVMVGDYSQREYELLADVPWEWTEKVDGTNVRLGWTPGCEPGGLDLIRGRTDNAQLPPKLLARLIEIHRSLPWPEVFGVEPNTLVTLYGEGYGAGIQKGGVYRPDQDFVLFDVKVNPWWLRRADVNDVAAKLGLDVVPVVSVATVPGAVEMVQYGFESDWPGAAPEGLVGRPIVDLFDRKGHRITTKIKARDFR